MRLSIFLAVSLFLTVSAQAQTKNFVDQPYIEVGGNADTSVIPNEIFIRIVLSEKDSRDRISIEELEQRMIITVKGLGINTDQDLSTSDMASNFKYYLLKSKDVIKSKIYILKVGDAGTASQVFVKLEEIDISNTSIERVEHSDMQQLRNLMRSKAILDAKQRAVALTLPLNQAVGSAIYISDSENISQQLQGRVLGVQIRGAASIQNDFKQLPKVEFEKIKVQSNISVKFILK
jgi:uncharacterized protein YggE